MVVKKKAKDKSLRKKRNRTKRVHSSSAVRAFFVKNRRDLIRAGIVILVLFALFFSFSFIFQFRSNYAEQIVMDISPQFKSLSLRGGDLYNYSVSVDIRPSFFCTVSCSYRFEDLSSGEVLDEGSFVFSNYKSHVFENEIFVDSLGSGQELYLYELSCLTFESRLCSATRFPMSRTALLSINYDLSEEEELKKAELEETLLQVEDLFESSHENILSAERKIDNLSFMKTDYLQAELLGAKFFMEVLENDFVMLEDAWQTQNFSFVSDKLNEYNIVEKSIYFKELSEDLLELVEFEVMVYNSVVDFLSGLEDNLSYYEDLRKIYSFSGFVEDENYLSALYSKVTLLSTRFESEDFRRYAELEGLLNDSLDAFSVVHENYFESLLDENVSLAYLNSWRSLLLDDLCILEGGDCAFGYDDFFSFPDNVSNSREVRNVVESICFDVDNISSRIGNLSDERSLARDNLSDEFLESVDDEKFLVDSSLLNFYLSESNNSNVVSVLENFSLTYFNNSLAPISYLDEYDSNLIDYALPAQYLANKSDFFKSVCSARSFEFPSLALNKETVEEVSVFVPNISLIRDVSANCCFQSVCVPCCDYAECREDLRNPLIVLHGYSFYSFNSALHSANAFNDFVLHALNDSLYVPAGIIGPDFYPDYSRYDLSRGEVPPVFKATYYDVVSFDDIRPGELNIKSHSIRDYATRLNDLVNLVRDVTGRSEVDIVAHSMGGLVTRAYIDEFGDDALDKIVLVGTPNKGVPSRLLHLCRFFGGQTECDEMYRKSAFMNYLNNEASIPQKDVHMIVGEGCSTFGEDGDGIVHTSSAELDFAENYYFTGSCDLIDNFHRDMIKPSRYPEIYDTIIDILLS